MKVEVYNKKLEETTVEREGVDRVTADCDGRGITIYFEDPGRADETIPVSEGKYLIVEPEDQP